MNQNKKEKPTKTAFVKTILLIILPPILMGIHEVDVEKITKIGILWFLIVSFFFRVKKLENNDESGFDSGKVIWENDKGRTLFMSYEDFRGDSTIRKISLKK